MWVYLIVFLVLILIIGNLLILLRTANVPKVPDEVKSQPYEEDDDDESGW